MAPSAIETTTESRQEPTLRLKADTGTYKVLAPTSIDRDAELNGKDGFKAAKVRCLGLTMTLPRQTSRTL